VVSGCCFLCSELLTFIRAHFVFCIVVSLCRHIHVVLLFNQLPHGESKPLRLKKLAKTRGPITKQAHLSSFALREDTELGRGALQVAARADLCPSGHTCTAPSGLSTSFHGIQTSASGEACSGRFRSRRPAGVLFLIHNASCLNLQSNVAGSLRIGAGTFRSIRGSPEEAVRWRRRFQGTKQLVFLPFTIIIFGPHIFLISFCVFTLAPFGTALKKDPSVLYTGAVVRVV